MSQKERLFKLIAAIVFTLTGIGLIVGFIIKINQSCADMCGEFSAENYLGQCCNPTQLYSNCTVKDNCGSNLVFLICEIASFLLALWGYCMVFLKEGGGGNPLEGIKPIVVAPTEQEVRKTNLYQYYAQQQSKRKMEQANRGYYYQMRKQGRF